MPSPNPQDYRDYVVLGLVTGIVLTATVFLYMYPSSETFGIWSGVVSATYGAFHWLCISDDKRVDAGNVVGPISTQFDDGADTRDWVGGEHVDT